MADKGHYRGKGGTRQGIYVASPDGELLASVNSLNAERVLEMMHAGLEAWTALEAKEAQTENSSDGPGAGIISPAHRWEMSYPESGLALVSRLRDVPESLDPTEPQAPKWNQDHAWFSQDEARQLMLARQSVSDARSPRVGEAWRLPSFFVERLARFHLLDAVVGQGLPYAPKEMVLSELWVEVVSLQDGQVSLRLSGRSRADADGVWRLGENDWTPKRPWPRGIEWELLGHARWDPTAQLFTQFELLGLAEWWGRSQFNGRRGEDPRGRIGAVVSLAPDLPAHRVAPAFVDLYEVPWVSKPAAQQADAANGMGTRADQGATHDG